MRNPDCVLYREMFLRHERASGAAEISRKCFTKVVDYAARYQCARNVRTSDRAAVGLLKHLVNRDRDAESVELFDNLLGAYVSRRTKLAESPLERLEMGQVERQKVHFVAIMKRAQLRSGDHADAKPLPSGARGCHAVHRIVIGERYRCQAAPLRRVDHSLRRKGTVRRCRMCVQVDEPRPARIVAHRS
jgi:hypothetical protein